MKKMYFWLAMVAAVAVGCSGKGDNDVDNTEAVDLTDVLELYEKNGRSYDVFDNEEVYLALCPEAPDTGCTIAVEIYDETPFTETFAEYKDSEHPFLRQAEDIYNSCLIINNLWSNFEVWCRFYDEEDTIVGECTRRVNVDCLRDKELREAATAYRDALADGLSGKNRDTHPQDARAAFQQVVEGKWYNYYDNADSLMDVMDKEHDRLQTAVEDRYQQYLKTDEESRLGVMLEALNGCERFDEQCALYERWADCKESEEEDAWIVAVGTRLLDGGRYYYNMFNVWLIWRTLCQKSHYGLSRDSGIPNELYNKYRATCYRTCLRYIKKHPDDLLAMNCASVLAGRANLLRYGTYEFGNQYIMDEIERMPERYKEIFEKAEDEEP